MGGVHIPTQRHFGGYCRELAPEPREDGCEGCGRKWDMTTGPIVMKLAIYAIM